MTAENIKNMGKTLEEIKKDVFAYCQQIGSDGDFLISDRLWLLQDFDGFVCQRQNKANQGTQVFAVNPNLDADDPHWAVAYAVLRLSDRTKSSELLEALQDVHDIAKDSILHGASRNDCARIFDKVKEAINAYKAS